MMNIDTTTVSLYLLSDPHDGVVRYVGQSHNPAKRYAVHMSIARHNITDKKSAAERWLEDLVADGHVPLMSVVATVRQDLANLLEERLIDYYRDTTLNGDKSRPSTWANAERTSCSEALRKEHVSTYLRAALTLLDGEQAFVAQPPGGYPGRSDGIGGEHDDDMVATPAWEA